MVGRTHRSPPGRPRPSRFAPLSPQEAEAQPGALGRKPRDPSDRMESRKAVGRILLLPAAPLGGAAGERAAPPTFETLTPACLPGLNAKSGCRPPDPVARITPLTVIDGTWSSGGVRRPP